MKIQLIIGSVREGRIAKPVADWAGQHLEKRSDMSLEIIDLKEWNLPLFDIEKPPSLGDYENPLQQRWADKIAGGDGYIFISPEYNHGYSPALKNALDYIYAEWNRKPATFISYGSVEGARSIEQLRQVLLELRMAPIRNALHIAGVFDKVKEGRFTPGVKEVKAFDQAVDDLLWWARTLAAGRAGNVA